MALHQRVLLIAVALAALVVITDTQIIQDCETAAYPPDQKDEIPSAILNLDLPPRDRWTHIVKPRRAQIQEFRDYVRHVITPFMYDWISKKVAKEGLKKLPRELREEIIGIANELNMAVGDILIGNIFYELEKLCTSIIAKDASGHVYHARNLDLGAMMGWDTKRKDWKITDIVRPMAVNVEFVSMGETVFKSVQYAGTVGVYTGVKPGLFSFALNSRSPEHRFGGPTSILRWMYGTNDQHKFASFWARDVMQRATSYEEAKYLFVHEPMLAPVYFTLAGTKPNEGIIISRNKMSSENPIELSDERQILVQTNYDHWESPPFYDDRRTPAMICMLRGVENQNNVNKAMELNSISAAKLGQMQKLHDDAVQQEERLHYDGMNSMHQDHKHENRPDLDANNDNMMDNSVTDNSAMDNSNTDNNVLNTHQQDHLDVHHNQPLHDQLDMNPHHPLIKQQQQKQQQEQHSLGKEPVIDNNVDELGQHRKIPSPRSISLPWMYNVLSTIPVLNKATVYTTLMDPVHGTMVSYRRYCPGNCYPW